MLRDTEAAYLAGIIDGEGSITLTRQHGSENRRPVISVASTDKDLLIYIKSFAGGVINNKRNYNPGKHKNSYTLTIKKKDEVFTVLKEVLPYLRVKDKYRRATLILQTYNKVTIRNGKYNKQTLQLKLDFEKEFFL